MSTFAILTALSLFSGRAFAQIYAPNCQLSWQWVRLFYFVSSSYPFLIGFQTFNSLGQDPCLVSAYLESTCNGGSPSSFFLYHLPILTSRTAFSVPALQPGYEYTGPSIDDYNLCKCNTVVYSLLSACDACQGAEWISYVLHPPPSPTWLISFFFSWALYSENCSTVYPASS
jgi:hypothetical protein